MANRCRLCARVLDSNNAAINLFANETSHLLKLIQDITGLMLQCEANKPKKICKSCQRRLLEITTFRKCCITAQSQLEMLTKSVLPPMDIEKQRIKQEKNGDETNLMDLTPQTELIKDIKIEVNDSSDECFALKAENVSRISEIPPTPQVDIIKNIKIEVNETSDEYLNTKAENINKTTEMPSSLNQNTSNNQNLFENLNSNPQLLTFIKQEEPLDIDADEISSSSHTLYQESCLSKEIKIEMGESTDDVPDSIQNTDLILAKTINSEKSTVSKICKKYKNTYQIDEDGKKKINPTKFQYAKSAKSGDEDIDFKKYFVVEYNETTNKRIYKCVLCDYGNNIMYKIKWHLRTHLGLKPYKCKFCPLVFRTKWNMKSHMGTHTGGCTLSCRYCDLHFRRYIDRRNHERLLHANKHPYICELCNKSFVHKKTFNYHCTLQGHLQQVELVKLGMRKIKFNITENEQC